MKRSFISLLLLVVLAAAPGALGEVRDLGSGLSYLRLHRIDDPLLETDQALILDLRYLPASASAGGLAALRERLQAGGPLRFVLYDLAPDPALVTLLETRAPQVLTIAPTTAQPPPDFAVPVEAVDDRAAYNALEAGAAIEELTQTSLPKRRLDEAALVRARNGHPAAEPEPAADEADPTTASPAPPADRLLQRAIHLARGLLALRRG